MLREYLFSESMHALGVPTTRSLAVIGTGRPIQRQMVEEAGVLVRVAASHIRVGSFHFAAHSQVPGLLQRLADYTVERHYPGADYRELFTRVMDAQAATVAGWMQVGFIHGVMNTDNTTLSGETIDYGPCAFMENYDLNTWFSSIDTQGRYRFGRQPDMLGWNLARLAESLLPLFDVSPTLPLPGPRRPSIPLASAMKRRAAAKPRAVCRFPTSSSRTIVRPLHSPLRISRRPTAVSSAQRRVNRQTPMRCLVTLDLLMPTVLVAPTSSLSSKPCPA